MAITKAQRERMLEYVVEKLRGNGEDIVPRTHQFYSGENSRLIRVGQDGIILLSDRVYTADQFSSIWAKLRQGFNRFANIFYKDHETYFKSDAARSNHRVARFGTMKGYSTSDLHDLIILKPAELIARDRWQKRVQYYQESERLNTGIVTYNFEPVTYDYGHLDRDSLRFDLPAQKESTKRFLNTKLEELTDDLKLEGSYIRSR